MNYSLVEQKKDFVISEEKQTGVNAPRKIKSCTRLSIETQLKPRNLKNEMDESDENIKPKQKQSISRLSDGKRIEAKQLFTEDEEDEEYPLSTVNIFSNNQINNVMIKSNSNNMNEITENMDEDDELKELSENKYLHFAKFTDIDNLERELTDQSLSKQYKELNSAELKENGVSYLSDIKKSKKQSEEKKPKKQLVLDTSKNVLFNTMKTISHHVIVNKIGDRTELTLKLGKPIETSKVNLINSTLQNPRITRTITVPTFGPRGTIIMTEKEVTEEPNQQEQFHQIKPMNLNVDMNVENEMIEEEENKELNQTLNQELESMAMHIRLSEIRNQDIE